MRAGLILVFPRANNLFHRLYFPENSIFDDDNVCRLLCIFITNICHAKSIFPSRLHAWFVANARKKKALPSRRECLVREAYGDVMPLVYSNVWKKKIIAKNVVMGWALTNELDSESKIFLKCRLWYVLSQLSKSSQTWRMMFTGVPNIIIL